MRAIVLTLFCFAGIGATFYAPYLGIVMWHWLSIMNPHRFTYGFTANLPIILVSAVVTLLLWVGSAEPKRLPRSMLCVVVIVFLFWVSVTTPYAALPGPAFDKWTEFVKIIGMVLVTIAATTTRMRLVTLVWVAGISIAFWGIKGGLYSLLTGGAHRVYGPDYTFISDNNAFGMALLMAIPLVLFLSEVIAVRMVKLALVGAVGMMSIAALMTYSRGAALGLAVIGLLVWWSSRRRVVTAVVFVTVVAVGQNFLPDQWFARMDTLNEYEKESSAASRLDYWKQAVNMGNSSPIVGYGFKGFLNPEVAIRHRENQQRTGVQEAHSIYFQVLGEHGYVGFGMFLFLGALYLIDSYNIYRRTRKQLEFYWASRLARALLLSGIAYFFSGAFLSQAYFDFYYLLIAMTICLGRIVRHGEAPPKIDNFPHVLALLPIDLANYGFGPIKPAPDPAVPALNRG